MVVRARNQTSAPAHSVDVSWEVPPPMHHRGDVVVDLPVLDLRVLDRARPRVLDRAQEVETPLTFIIRI